MLCFKINVPADVIPLECHVNDVLQICGVNNTICSCNYFKMLYVTIKIS